MRKNLAVYLQVYTDENSSFPKPFNNSYSFWSPLLTYFLEEADTVEFYCWKEEVKVIKELLAYNLESTVDENLTTLKGALNPPLLTYITDRYLFDDGQFNVLPKEVSLFKRVKGVAQR